MGSYVTFVTKSVTVVTQISQHMMSHIVWLGLQVWDNSAQTS